MSNLLSSQLLGEMFASESTDPFLLLVTITHPTFTPIYLVNNTEDIISNGVTFTPFPMTITLPPDDGESAREVAIEFDNVSLELIDELRSVTTPVDVKLEMVLASNPDTLQYTIEDLKMRSVSYNKSRISAKLFMDSFLNVELSSERYTPTTYRGLF